MLTFYVPPNRDNPFFQQLISEIEFKELTIDN